MIGRIERLVGDERQHVGGHRLHRVVELAAPLGVAVAPLVQRVDVVAVGQVQADEIPRVRRLVATVEQQHAGRVGVAPLGEVEAHPPQDGLPRDVPHRGVVRDAQVGGTLEQAGELAEERMSLGARSSANSFRYTAWSLREGVGRGRTRRAGGQVHRQSNATVTRPNGPKSATHESPAPASNTSVATPVVTTSPRRSRKPNRGSSSASHAITLSG